MIKKSNPKKNRKAKRIKSKSKKKALNEYKIFKVNKK
jgi:hypothetical protein